MNAIKRKENAKSMQSVRSKRDINIANARVDSKAMHRNVKASDHVYNACRMKITFCKSCYPILNKVLHSNNN